MTQRILPQRSLNLQFLLDPSLVIITIQLLCLICAQLQRRKLLKKYIHFTLFNPKIISLLGGVHEIYNVLSRPLTLQMLHTKFGKVVDGQQINNKLTFGNCCLCINTCSKLKKCNKQDKSQNTIQLQDFSSKKAMIYIGLWTNWCFLRSCREINMDFSQVKNKMGRFRIKLWKV